MRSYAVLIVDDEPSILKSLERLLRLEQYTIRLASDAKTALEMLESAPVDIVISDQRMPGMCGTDFLKIVKARYPGIVRILFSGYTDFNSIVSAINDASVYKFITKPWDNHELISLLNDVVTNDEASRIAADAINQLIQSLRPIDELKCSIQRSGGKVQLLCEYQDATFLRESLVDYLEKSHRAAKEMNKMLRDNKCGEINEISLIIYGGDEVVTRLDLPMEGEF